MTQLEPTNTHAYHNRGLSFDKLGQHHEAVRDFRKVLELEQAGGSAGVGLGQVGLNRTASTSAGTTIGTLEKSVSGSGNGGGEIEKDMGEIMSAASFVGKRPQGYQTIG